MTRVTTDQLKQLESEPSFAFTIASPDLGLTSKAASLPLSVQLKMLANVNTCS
jgi:hypothetical protein